MTSTDLYDKGRHWASTHQTPAVFIGVALGLTVMWLAWKLASKAGDRLSRLSGRIGQTIRNARDKGDRPRWRVEDVLTALIALTATTYAGTGNWQFLSKATHYGADLKAVLVWVFEGAVVVEGLRARRNILTYGEPGIDGRGLWIFAAASSVLSVSEAGSIPEALARLMVPLIAAFLWERLMKAPLDAEAMRAAKERREELRKLSGSAGPKRRISWRIRPERVLVWVGLADSADTTALAAESNRRIMRYVKAAERADRVAAGDKTHRLPWTAAAREARAERKLTAHGLLSYADPTEVYERLSRQKMAATLKRLGVEVSEPEPEPELIVQEETETVPAQRTESESGSMDTIERLLTGNATPMDDVIGRLLLAEPPEWGSLTIQAAIERADAIVPDGPKTPRELVEILARVGVETSEAYVRTVRQRVRAREADTEVIDMREASTIDARESVSA